MDLELLKYPTGKYTPPRPIERTHLQKWMATISAFPEKMETEVKELTDNELGWHYRPDGWTIRQVVHHCADSHMNAFIRFKLSLTEDQPTIRPYLQSSWAEMPDVLETPIAESLKILHGLHKRWSILLENMEADNFKRTYIHPEYGQTFSLDHVTGMYAWHCAHHLAHVRQAIHYKGSFN